MTAFFAAIRWPDLDTRFHFYNYGNVKLDEVIGSLGALAQESRLNVLRLLVRRGPQGHTPGELSEKLAIPAPTLSFHLKELQHAGLVSAHRQGRFLHYTASFERVRGLIEFLTDQCCIQPGQPAPDSTLRRR